MGWLGLLAISNRPREKKFSFYSILFLLGRGNYQLSIIELSLLAIPYQELLKTLWSGWEMWEMWEVWEAWEDGEQESSKKRLISIAFLMKKPLKPHTHNFLLMPKFYVEKDVYKV